jgi:hypothetical protein
VKDGGDRFHPASTQDIAVQDIAVEHKENIWQFVKRRGDNVARSIRPPRRRCRRICCVVAGPSGIPSPALAEADVVGYIPLAGADEDRPSFD